MVGSTMGTFWKWVEESESSESYSLVALLEELGYRNVLWLILSNDEIYLIDNSESIDTSLLTDIREEKNFEKIKNWMKDTIHDHIIHFRGSDPVILHVNPNHYGSLAIVLAETNDENMDHSITRYWTKLAIKLIDKDQKISTLENALRIGYMTPESNQSGNLTDLVPSNIKPRFIEDLVPYIFYSVAHEDFGPMIFESIPNNLIEPDYLIIAVKLFSGLDAEVVAELGHVYTTNPIKSPNTGEIFSIVFSLPNQKARGEFEIHSLSIFIPQQYYNFSKSLTGEFKTKLFVVAEQVRLLHEEKSWNIAVEKVDDSQSIRNQINPLLDQLRRDIALTYALKMNPDDVLNW